MKVIVGLGNPGREYSLSRHNIGFRCVNHFARLHGIEVKRRRARAMVGEGIVAGAPVVLAKPQTFMNLSGESVRLLLEQYDLEPEDMVVVYDDLDLPLGRVRIRPRGGGGGHHGMESIIGAIGSRDFPRIRVGIGRPGDEEAGASVDVVGYVLGPFYPDEGPAVEQAIARVSEALHAILAEGLEKAMNRSNTTESLAEAGADSTIDFGKNQRGIRGLNRKGGLK
ncbi:MAG: aminoacyl-tRNA hydrolase [Candidatus Thermoplasmatota archaeon]